jgi:hypothetical protein
MLDILFGVPEKDYHSVELYHKDLYDQYRLFIEMTDRMHQRRQQLVNWFLTLNTGFITAIGVLVEKEINLILIAGLAFIGVSICVIWRKLLKSYKQIKCGRFQVIHEIEEKLPLQLFKAEWEALKEGKDFKTYEPVTQLEQSIPMVFGAAYILVVLLDIAIKYCGG